jgi:hypothetical protein
LTIDDPTPTSNHVITPSKHNKNAKIRANTKPVIPPRFKRNNLLNLNTSDDSEFSSPEQSNELQPKRQYQPPKKGVIPKRTLPPSKQTQASSPSYKDVVLIENKDDLPSSSFITATKAKALFPVPKPTKDPNSSLQLTKLPPPHLVPLTQPLPTAISTTSTLTPNNSATTLCNKYLTDQVGQLTRMFSKKYDSAIVSMESEYQKKFEQLMHTNNTQMTTIHSKIDRVQEVCTNDIQEVRNECLNFQSQFKEQNVMLSSLKELILNRNKEDGVKQTYAHLKKKRDKKKRKESRKKRHEKRYEIMNYEASDDNDISYTDSEHLDQGIPDDPNNTVTSLTPTTPELSIPIDSTSVSTHSTHSATSVQTRNTSYSNSNSTQTTAHMSSVASMVSDTRVTFPTSVHSSKAEWTIVQSSKNNNLTKHREAGLLKPVFQAHNSQSKHSPRYNRYDPDGTIQSSPSSVKESSLRLLGKPSEHDDLPICSPIPQKERNRCEDQVT